ncbi:enoyl-CoA hydratase/isomerase family protein [Thermomonospora cellulosilytica]|uniref:Enoyl-CoA hydratase/carnithine racemase n=1 Tax=Thermomonospora cellulosilytica TaxID=1411118 RepID=A0A7W3N0W5_9ACTN|nr:enoyl-CoA hydratase-related protein [Thermomonospora cellulosilytica]MBA9005434.1 enoyl-CoA hydratase/carnithine racemase [Thermomonospora cellulosilytica]
MATDVLRAEDRERVRTLTFHRPEAANAFNEALYLAVADALERAADDDGVSVVLLTGSGRTFTAGTDLREMADLARAHASGETAGDAGKGFTTLMDALVGFPKPLMAAVNGAGVGLGLTMLAHCDLVLLAEDARLLAPFTTMGVAPEAASSYLLPQRMGRQRAALALLTGRWITADEAVAAGLALRTCPPDALLEAAHELAREIAAKPLPSLLATKRLMGDAHRDAVRQAMEREAAAFAELLRNAAAADNVLARLD